MPPTLVVTEIRTQTRRFESGNLTVTCRNWTFPQHTSRCCTHSRCGWANRMDDVADLGCLMIKTAKDEHT